MSEPERLVIGVNSLEIHDFGQSPHSWAVKVRAERRHAEVISTTDSCLEDRYAEPEMLQTTVPQMGIPALLCSEKLLGQVLGGPG